MTTMPGVTYDPLASVQGEPRMTAHDVVCIHTMVGSLAGVRRYFKDGGWSGVESHFGTSGSGEILQWQSIAYQADANLDGVPTVVSIENADNSEPCFASWNTNDSSAVPAFTPEQIEANAQILAWLARPETHASCPSGWKCHDNGIPLALIPDTKPGRRGVGYHAQGVPGNGLVAGGVRWSSAYGKSCPGRRRIAQIPQIIARAIQINSTTGEAVLPVDPSGPTYVEETKGEPLGLYEYGPRVRALQLALGFRFGDADGYFGPSTLTVLKQFQARRGLDADGVAGSATMAALAREAHPVAPPAEPTVPQVPIDGVWGPMTTKALQRELDVERSGRFDTATKRALQRHLGVVADGTVGPVTVRAMQAGLDVPQDGVVGPQTVKALQRRLNAGRLP